MYSVKEIPGEKAVFHNSDVESQKNLTNWTFNCCLQQVLLYEQESKKG